MNLRQAAQLIETFGGPRFIEAAGAKQFVFSEDCLQFRIKRGATNRASLVRVVSDGEDTFSMQFLEYGPGGLKVVSQHPFNFMAKLPAIFAEQTGMHAA